LSNDEEINLEGNFEEKDIIGEIQKIREGEPSLDEVVTKSNEQF